MPARCARGQVFISTTAVGCGSFELFLPGSACLQSQSTYAAMSSSGHCMGQRAQVEGIVPIRIFHPTLMFVREKMVCLDVKCTGLILKPLYAKDFYYMSSFKWLYKS